MAEQVVKPGKKRALDFPIQEEVPFIDLTRQYKQYKYEIKSAISRVLASGQYSAGDEVAAFEEEFAQFCDVSQCIAVSNGIEAIKIALRTQGVRPGDGVVTVANAGMHSTIAILEIGAVPQFADIDPISMNMSPEGLISAITAHTRAVIVTHLFGRVAKIQELCAIARQFDLPLVEDCFQAHGARIEGKAVGSWGDLGCYCFSPERNLGALGEAGAIITKDEKLAENAREYRQNGQNHHHYSSSLNASGSSNTMDEIQAAVLRAKLPLLEEWNLHRRMIAQTYKINLDASSLNIQSEYQPECSVFQTFTLRSPIREKIMQGLKRNGIGCKVQFPLLDHLHPACSDLGYLPGMLPETEKTSTEVLSLPCFPELTSWEVEKVCQAVNEALVDYQEFETRHSRN